METAHEKSKAPVGWEQLLRDAVEQPGIISAAYSAFHGYSIGNQMLAMWQCHARGLAVGPLATYKTWQDKGRQVRKGEKALILCMPITGKRKGTAADGGEETESHYTFFAYRPLWFTVYQTDGADQGAVTVPGWDKGRALDALKIDQCRYDMADGNCQGYAKGRGFSINPIAQHPDRTMFHELGHIVLGHTAEHAMQDSEQTPRTLREAEAESVAMICCEVLGCGGLVESRGYIQSWLQGAGIPDRSAQKIFGAAQTILSAGREQS